MVCTVLGWGERYRAIARGCAFWPFAVLGGSFSLLLCYSHVVMVRSALFGGRRRQFLLVASCAYGFVIVNLALQGLGIFRQCVYLR